MLSRHEYSGPGPHVDYSRRGAAPSALLWSLTISTQRPDAEDLTPGVPKGIQMCFIHPPGEDPEYYAIQSVIVVRKCDLSG